jgi:hypothetical protein
VITDLTTPNGNTIRRLFAQSIRHYRPALEARLTRMNWDGDRVDLGPDYLTRIAAVRMLAHLCTLGRKPLPPPEPPGHWLTIEELKRLAAEEARPVPAKARAANAKAKGNPGGKLPKPAHPPLSNTAPLRICDLTNAHQADLRKLFAFGLRSMNGCFEARKLRLNRDGDIVDLGPDVQAGLAGIELLAQLATQGQQPLSVSREPKQRPNAEIYAILQTLALIPSAEINPDHGNH